MYALNRLQAETGTWYWAVHLQRRGKRIDKCFYDPKHGGPSKAKAAAIAWRDEQLASLPALTLVEFCQQVRGNNTSGVPGVHFLKDEKQPLGVWQAKIKLGGKARHKSFSVRKHGYETAYKLAVAARGKMVAEADDTLYLYDRLAIQRAKL